MVQAWAESRIKEAEIQRRADRLTTWKLRLLKSDGPVWKWRARDKATPAVHAILCADQIGGGDDLPRVAASYWRQHWPSRDDYATRGPALGLKATTTTTTHHNQRIRPIQMYDLRSAIGRASGKAAGMDGWHAGWTHGGCDGWKNRRQVGLLECLKEYGGER